MPLNSQWRRGLSRAELWIEGAACPWPHQACHTRAPAGKPATKTAAIPAAAAAAAAATADTKGTPSKAAAATQEAARTASAVVRI